MTTTKPDAATPAETVKEVVKPKYCQEQIHYTIDPVGEGRPVGSFYCILKQGHEGPHRIFAPDQPELGEEESEL